MTRTGGSVDNLSSILSGMAASVVIEQARLDQQHLADLSAMKVAAESARGLESLVADIWPARLVAAETQIEFGIATAVSEGEELAGMLINVAFSRRFAKTHNGQQRIRLTVRSAHYNPGQRP